MLRYLTVFCVTLACCFAMQRLVLQSIGGRTAKSESNYFSSIARIQYATSGSATIAFLGSSITGRLPDRTQGFAGIVNMGSDGGSAIDTLRAMDSGVLPLVPVLVIEANTLFRVFDSREAEIAQALRSWWFRLGCRFVAFSATARPSAFFYSALLARKIGVADVSATYKVPISTSPTIPSRQHSTLGDAASDHILNELGEVLARLRNRGSSCWIVMLPTGRELGPERYRNIGQILAARVRLPFWDLWAGTPRDAIKLTDGVHMTPASASLVVRELVSEIER